MHPFHRYVATQLDKRLRERQIVVFYDPRRELEPFVDELRYLEPPAGRGGLPRVWVEDLQTHVVRYEGSFFALKAAVEPIMELDKPEPLLVYVPGVARDRETSVLMELEKAGTCYEPQLRRLARNELRRHYTDGDIDEMLPAEGLTYEDVVRCLEQAGSGSASLVKLVLGEAASEELLVRWLVGESHDPELEKRNALPELFKLVAVRLGLALEPATALAKARHRTLRYLLVNEFRDDLTCEAPPSLGVVSAPATQEEHQRVREVAALLRRRDSAWYVKSADVVEAELRLADLGLDPATLGSIDTFRFEERLLLGHAAKLVSSGRYDAALGLVAERGHSFWTDRTLDGARWAQWEVCRLAASLGRQVKRVSPALESAGDDPRRWVESYSAADGWHAADRTQRALEAWVARMDEEPEEPLEKALGLVRRAHEKLLEEMARGFARALEAGSWTVTGILHQTQVFPEVVEAALGPTAYFLVDALRYEMGVELAEQLREAEDLRLVPALSVLPSITPLAMAALLPEASSSYSVIERKGKLAACIDGSEMASLAERMKFLKARRPQAVDLDLGQLLQKATKTLKRKLDGIELLLVRSQSIDGLGEMDGGLLARQIMDTVVSNVARAVRKLASMGFERFVIVADHGHQFSLRKGEDMLLDKPGGETVDLHRRCWAGRGGHTSTACVRVTGQQLGYDTDLDFVFPRGLAVFRSGGDLAYHHGGTSLQEMVVPVLSLRIPAAAAAATGSPVTLEGYPQTVTNRTFGLRLVVQKELFMAGPVPVRLVLVSRGQEVGRAGMAVDAELDRAAGIVKVPPGQWVNVAMMLTRERLDEEIKVDKVRVVAQDPATDAVLGQSEELAVKLGI